MRLDIRYVTRFDYVHPVHESQNELRACPANDDRQQLLHYHVTTNPSARIASYTDYWGTRVDTFGIRHAHDVLEVVAEATVDTVEAARSVPSVPARAFADQQFRDQHFAYLQPSPHTSWGVGVDKVARECADVVDDDAMSLVTEVHRRVAELDYQTGQTYVGVEVETVLASGGGVCQDFAHLAVSIYRALGIPARYVSGYLFTGDDATGTDVVGDVVEVQTHAWVEVAVPSAGWLAFDPTNAQEVGQRHVTIGRGRDYDDVAPLRGVFSGPPEHKLDVKVTMRRFAPEPATAALDAGNRIHQSQQAQQQ